MTDLLALTLGLPIVFYLTWTAIRRARQVRERIAQVQKEMQTNPLPPLAQLATLLDEQQAQDKPHDKRPH